MKTFVNQDSQLVTYPPRGASVLEFTWLMLVLDLPLAASSWVHQSLSRPVNADQYLTALVMVLQHKRGHEDDS